MKNKLFKRLLQVSLTVAVFLNIIIVLHAYKFTHFTSPEIEKTAETNLSIGEKLYLAIMGVNNPKPLTKIVPDIPYKKIIIPGDIETTCWYMETPSAKGTVVLFHGYGGEKSSMLGKAYIFFKSGYNTLLVDQMGAGDSEGNTCTIGYFEANQVKISVEYLRSIGENNIVLFGTSMGAVSIMRALHLKEVKPNAIIIECPFGSMLETVEARFKMMNLPTFPFAHLLVFWGGTINGFNAFSHNPEKYALNIDCPTLLMYGKKDIKVSELETDRIFKNIPAANKKLVKFPDAGHENYLNKYANEWTKEIADFLIIE